MLDAKQVKKEAVEEVNKEKMELAKEKIKVKLRELHNARKIVRNLERELEDVYDEIGQD